MKGNWTETKLKHPVDSPGLPHCGYQGRRKIFKFSFLGEVKGSITRWKRSKQANTQRIFLEKSTKKMWLESRFGWYSFRWEEAIKWVPSHAPCVCGLSPRGSPYGGKIETHLNGSIYVCRATRNRSTVVSDMFVYFIRFDCFFRRKRFKETMKKQLSLNLQEFNSRLLKSQCVSDRPTHFPFSLWRWIRFHLMHRWWQSKSNQDGIPRKFACGAWSGVHHG